MEEVLGQAGVNQDLQVLPSLRQNILGGSIMLKLVLKVLLLLERRHDSRVQLLKLLMVLTLIHRPQLPWGVDETRESKSERQGETKQETAAAATTTMATTTTTDADGTD
jgi:hypothetical protein